MQHLRKYIGDNNITSIKQLAELLKNEFSIKCREDIDANGNKLYTFKYDQINSPKGHPIVCECRGIILDEYLNLVYKAFDRFFNLGELLEVTEKFDWSNEVEVFEKSDGSFVKLYCHKGVWQVGTSSTATAEVPFNSDGWNTESKTTFREKIIEAFGYASEEDFQEDAKRAFLNDVFYVFEYTSPENRIVTPYTETEMVFLSAFDKDGELNNDECRYEFEDMQYDILNVRLPKKYTVNSQKELLELVDNLEGLQEGFVVRDINGMRLKVKSKLYVAAHRLRGDNGLTLRNTCKLVLTNEHAEYLSYFPDDKDKILSVVDVLNTYFMDIANAYATVSMIESQKDFALAIKDLPYAQILFNMRKNKCTAAEAFNSNIESSKLKILEKLVKEAL